MKLEIIRKKEYGYLFLIATMFFLMAVGKKAGAEGGFYLIMTGLLVGLVFTVFGAFLNAEFGRFIGKRIEKRDLSDLWQFEKMMLIFQVVVGALGFAVLFLSSPFWAGLFHIPELEAMLRMAAFLIPLRGLRSTLGEVCFSLGNRLLHFIARAIECGILFTVGSWIILKYDAYGKSVSDLLRQPRFYSYYLIMGLVLAAIVAEAVTVIFLFLVVFVCTKRIILRADIGMNKRTHLGLISAYNRVIWKILSVLAGCGMLLYLIQTTLQRYASLDQSMLAIGTWIGSVGLFGTLLLLVSLFFVTEYLYRMQHAVAREEKRNARVFFMYYLQYGFSFVLMPMILCIILSEQVAGFTGLSKETVGGMMGLGMLVFVLLMVMPVIFSAWQHIRPSVFFISLLACCIFTGFVCQKWVGDKEPVEAMIVSLVVCFGLFVLLHLFLLFREIGYSTDILFRVLIPVIDALVIGLIMMLLRNLTYPHLGDGFTIIVCFLSGLVLYWAVLFVLHLVRDQDLKYMPFVRRIYNGKGKMAE